MPGTGRTRHSRIVTTAAAVLLLLATTSCGHMDDIMDEARDVIDEAGDVVDAIRDNDGDAGSDDGSTSQSGVSSSSGGQTVDRPPRPTGTIAVGARVTSDANGKGVAAAAGNTFHGVAVTAGADGEFFEIELNGPGGAQMPT